MRFNKIWVKYVIDIGLLITFTLVFITGVLKFPGLTRYFRAVFRTIPAYTISRVHDWSGMAMGLLAITHVILEWGFISTMTKRLFVVKK